MKTNMSSSRVPIESPPAKQQIFVMYKNPDSQNLQTFSQDEKMTEAAYNEQFKWYVGLHAKSYRSLKLLRVNKHYLFMIKQC